MRRRGLAREGCGVSVFPWVACASDLRGGRLRRVDGGRASRHLAADAAQVFDLVGREYEFAEEVGAAHLRAPLRVEGYLLGLDGQRVRLVATLAVMKVEPVPILRAVLFRADRT